VGNPALVQDRIDDVSLAVGAKSTDGEIAITLFAPYVSTDDPSGEYVSTCDAMLSVNVVPELSFILHRFTAVDAGAGIWVVVKVPADSDNPELTVTADPSPADNWLASPLPAKILPVAPL
jgi:hypothetical protein